MLVQGGPGGGGLPWPPGNPGGVRAAAANLGHSASGLSRVNGSLEPQVAAALEAWRSPATAGFSSATGAIKGGVQALGQGMQHAGTVLHTYADALEKAQDTARRAQQMLSSAEHTFTTSMGQAGQQLDSATTQLGSATTSQATATATAAQHAAQQAQQNAVTAFNLASNAATALAEQACSDARRAASDAAGQLSSIAGAIKSQSVDDWVTELGAAGIPIELGGLAGVGVSGMKLWTVLSAIRSQDWDVIEKLDPEKWAEVEKVLAETDPGDMSALVASLKYEEEIGNEGVKSFLDSLGSFGKISELEGLAKFMDAVGKVGVGVAVVGDVLTFVDPSAHIPDKVIAGLNLVGVGGAGLGTTFGSALAGMVGIDTVAGWIPVAGQVLIGVTAAAAAGMFVYEHWGTIEHGAEDVGNDLVAVDKWEVQQAGQLGSDALHITTQLGSDAITGVTQLASSTVTGMENLATSTVNTVADVGSGVVNTGAHLVSGVAHGAEHLLSDLNPF